MKRFNSHYQLLVAVFFILLTTHSLRAQQFPISVNTILTTPALPYLEDFIQENSNALMTTISLNDPTTQSFDVGLRLTISGQGITITSDPLYFGDVYTLTQGIPTILTGFELAEYFDVDHLIFAGISKQQYLAQGRLPEGLYSICFEAFDIQSPNALPVSNTGCGVGVIEEYDPPVFISLLGESPFLPSQNYLFSWQPLHPGNFNVNYYVEIWEKIDGISDADLIQSETPYAQFEVSNLTNYIYSLVDPLLQPETDYLMRIQVEDPLGQFLFKNNGYGEPQSFSLSADCIVGDPCDDNNPCTENDVFDVDCSCFGTTIPNCGGNEIPCSLTSPPVVEMAEEIEDYSFIANWSGDMGCFDYVLLEWARDESYLDEFESIVIENTDELSFAVENVDLLAGDYYYRLSGYIGSSSTPYSENMLVSQNRCKSLSAEVMDYACGIYDSTLINQSPLLVNLDKGAKVYASDWLVEITEVSGTNRFNGRAIVTNDILPQAQINLVFSDISVNQDCQMVDGFMEVEGFGLALISPEISAMLDSLIVGIDMALDALDIYEAVVNSVNEIINETEGINDYISGDWDLTDGVGDIWDEYPYLDEDIVNAVQDALDCFTASAVVNIDTCLTQLQVALEDLQDAIEDQYNSSYQVKFFEEQNEMYGYDLYTYPEMSEFYDEISIAGEPYRIPWVMVPSEGNGNRDLRAKKMSGGKLGDETRIENTLPPPVELAKQPTGDETEVIVNFGGNPHEEIHPLYAYEEQGDSVKIAGKANVVSYDKLPLKVCFVNVEGVAYPSIDWDGKLDSVFGAANVDIDIISSKSISLDNPVIQDNSGSGMWSNYTTEMQDIISEIDGVEEDVYYLIMMQGNVDGSKLGYMPRGKKYGFIYTENIGSSEEALVKTVAHEIGHGAFKLRHMADNFDGWSHTGTDLLMEDNPDGTHLTYFEWGRIHNPEGDWSLFDEDGEGEYVVVDVIEIFEDYVVNGILTFIDPSGNLFRLPYSDIQSLVFVTGSEIYSSGKYLPLGTLYKFSIKEENVINKYRYCRKADSGKFKTIMSDSLSCEGTLFEFETNENSLPIICRAHWDGGNLEINYLQISNYEKPEKITYDFLITEFFSSIPGGVISKGLFSTINNSNKSDEFEHQLYETFILQYPDFLDINKLSSFYINVFPKFLESMEQYIDACDLDDLELQIQLYNIFSKWLEILNRQESEVLVKDRNQLIKLEESYEIEVQYNTNEGPEFKVEEWTSYYGELGNILPNLFSYYLEREKTIDLLNSELYAYLNSPEKEKPLQNIIIMINDFFRILKPCELDQIQFDDLELIKKLIIHIVASNPKWVNSREENIIRWLIDKVKEEDFEEFLLWIENATFIEADIQLPVMYSVCYDCHTLINKYVWKELLERVDDNEYFVIGEQIHVTLVNMYVTLLKGNDNVYKEKYLSLINRIETETIKDNGEINYEAISSIPTVPFNYATLLSGWELKQNFKVDFSTLFGYFADLNPVPVPSTYVTITAENKLNINSLTRYGFGYSNDATVPNYHNVGLFDPVFLDTKSNFSIDREFFKDSTDLVPIPAFLLYHFYNKGYTQAQFDAIMLFIDVATLPLPVSKLRYIGKALYIADKSSSLLSIAATATKQNDPELSTRLGLLSAAMGAITLSEFGLARMEVFKNVHDQVENATRLVSSIKVDDLEILDALRIQAYEDLAKNIVETSEIKLLDQHSLAEIELLNHYLQKSEDLTDIPNLNESTLAKAASEKLISILEASQIAYLRQLITIAKESNNLIRMRHLEGIEDLYITNRIAISLAADNETLIIKTLSEIDELGVVTPNSIEYADQLAIPGVKGDAITKTSREGKAGVTCVGQDCALTLNCFPAGTKISANGKKILIEDINAGILVDSYDHTTNKVVKKKVKDTFASTWNKMIHLFFGGKKISCTPDHRFWLPELGKYSPADSLMKGVKVLTLAVGLMSLDSVAYADTIYTAYNFEVEDNHNYFVGEDGILVHNHCSVKSAQIDVDVFDEVFPLGDNYTELQRLVIRNQLGDDIGIVRAGEPNSALHNFFSSAIDHAERVKRLKAWKKVAGRAYSTDVPFLEKLSDIMEPSVLNKLPNGEADLDDIISALVHPHTGASHTFMKQAAEHLDDVKHFINNFDHLSGKGFEDIISALGNPNFYAQDGASYMLTKLKSIDVSKVVKMEGKIIDADNLDGICVNCLFDIELVGGKKLELKSYSKSSIEKISTNSKFKNQFKAYLADAQNFNSYEYIFNSKKATNFDLAFVKENFQSLFSKNNHEIFDQIGGAQNSLMQSLGIVNKSDFIDAVSDLGDDLYKFIKLE